MFQTIGDRLLIKPLKSEKTTQSGIFVPEMALTQKAEGEVIYAGEMCDADFEKGSRVAYIRNAGEEIHLDGEDYRIVQEKDILGIFN